MGVEIVTGTWGGRPGAFVSDEPRILLTDEARAVESEWRELCVWDPSLPPNAEPPLAREMVSAVLDSVDRPQPLGWGPDLEIESIAGRFATAAGPINVVIGMLICLREAFRRQSLKKLAGAELTEANDRIQMVVDRAISVSAERASSGLEARAYADPVTALSNRWALDRDLSRELGRADRHRHHLGVVTLDLDGLKRVNDTKGHAAGDQVLCDTAEAMRTSLRRGDAAFRVGGDEFVILLAEIDPLVEASAPEAVVKRMEAAGAPPFSWGAAIFPADGRTAEELLAVADSRLLESRVLRGYRR